MTEQRKKFYEEINERIAELMKQLIEEFPELDGAAVALAYSPEIGDPPSCLVLADLNNSHLACRLGLQTAKLQIMVSRGIASHIAAAIETVAKLTQELDAKQRDDDDPPCEEKEGGAAGAG